MGYTPLTDVELAYLDGSRRAPSSAVMNPTKRRAAAEIRALRARVAALEEERVDAIAERRFNDA